MRTALVGLLLLAAGGTVFWLTRDGGPRERPVLRDPEPLPQPDAREQARYWCDLYLGGRQESVAGRRLPVWQLLARPVLLELGERAVGELLAPEREAAYRASPQLLLPVLDVLPELPGAAQHPRFAPFLLARYAEADDPDLRGARALEAGDLRKAVVRVFSRLPEPAFAPACVRELDRRDPAPDLRELAVHVLFETGRDEEVRARLDGLPPDEEEPGVELRYHVLERLEAMAVPSRPAATRDRVRAWRELLLRYARSADPREAIPAAGALRHLGDEAMADRLIELYREGSALGDPGLAGAWTAVKSLAEGRPHPFVRRECTAIVRAGRYDFATLRALEHLGDLYASDPETRALLWDWVDATSRTPEEGGAFAPYPVLRHLLPVDRERVVDFLRAEWASGTEARRFEAVRFAMTYHVRELGPTLLEELRVTTDPERRSLRMGQLTLLGAEGLLPLLLSEFASPATPDLRRQAAACLLDLGRERGLAALDEALRSADPDVLALLFERAIRGGRYGVPERLLPATAEALGRGPGEDERMRALTVFRLAAPPEPAWTAVLRDAWRREPSRRVARAIRQVLVERAHR